MKRGISIGLGCVLLACGADDAVDDPDEVDGGGAEAPGEDDDDGTPDDDDDDSDDDDDDAARCPQPPTDDPGFVDPLDHLGRAEGDTFIEILDVLADGDIVYSCTATQGLTIWDASDPSEAALLVEDVGPAGLAHPQFPRCQHLGYDPAAQQMVITNRGDEVQPDPWLYLYDIADPASPQPLRGFETSASVEGVVLRDGRILAAAHSSGILVIEDDGAELAQVGAFSDGDSDAWALVLEGDTLYAAEGTTGLRIYDVSSDDPVLLGEEELPGSSKDLVVEDGVAYLAASSFVVAVDVSDPAAPTVLTERQVAGTALTLEMGADGVLIVAEWDEVRGYDSGDPDLTEVLSETVPGDGAAFTRVLALGTEASQRRVYVGEWRGMHAYDQRAPGSAPEVLATPGSVQFPTVLPGEREDLVMVVRNSGNAPLEIYDVATAVEGIDVEPQCALIQPGGAEAFEVRFEPSSDTPQTGVVALRTNDPDEPEFHVGLSANIPGLDVGDPAPDFSLNDLDGQNWTRSELEGQILVLSYFATF